MINKALVKTENISMSNYFSSTVFDRLLLALFIIMSPAGFSQENEIWTAKATQAKKVSHYYEVLIRDELSKYYNERTFLVDATAYLEAPKPDTASIEYNGVKALPGLPVLPDELRSGLPPAHQTGAVKSLSIKNIKIEILVDSSYGDKDIAFISKLVSMTANLNKYRGDKLKVRKGVFPFKNMPAMEFQRNEIPASDKPPKESAEKSVEAVSNPFRPYVDNLASLVPLIIVCLFLLLIVWIIVRAFLGKKNNARDAYSSILNEINQLKASLPKDNTPPASIEAKPSELEGLRSFLLSSFIGNSQLSTQTLNNWIQEDKTGGITDAAIIIKAVDEKLLNVILPELEKSLSQELEIRINSSEMPSPEEALPVLKKFKSDFQKKSLHLVDESEYRDLFGFLKQLNEQQLLHLLKEESEGIIGMVLAQLGAGSSSRLLQKMDKAKRAKILAAMGKIDKIPLTLYKQLADRLSAKALEVVKMRYVTADGVESVLEILENLPLSVQEEYLNSLAETDIYLAEKIRSIFITLPEVAGLPDKFLLNAVSNLDRDIFIRALVQAEDSLKNKILRLLPERMRQMIRSGMENMVDLSPEEAESAQIKLLQKIRKEIRQMGGKPV